ncbi:MAG: Nre family DNA repair protein [Promethearchaeota archaeon]
MVRPPTEGNICLRCKGARLLCGKKTCPILLKKSVLKSMVPFKLDSTIRDVEIFGASPPGVFIGHFNYPNVYIGPLVPFQEFDLKLNISDNYILDAPELWFGKEMVDIILYRSSLVRNNFKTNVRVGRTGRKNTPSIKVQKLLDASQELAMAARPVDTETKLGKMNFRMLMDNHAPPIGPTGMTEKIEITENVKVHPKVDYCVSDTDLKATNAISEYLYFNGHVPESTIRRIFSAGLLGQKSNRRLVPTRWSITAVDDIISKALIKEIKKFPEIDNFQIFESTYLDNHFKILLFPGKFMYEMNEVWAPNTLWNIALNGNNRNLKPQIMTDFEFYRGRKNYASNITGAYYAARKSICEYLYNIKRQARVLIFREVSGGYVVPLGVWVIRETCRNAMYTTEPITLDNFSDAITKMAEGFMVDFKYWKKSSKLINFIKKQRSIYEYL